MVVELSSRLPQVQSLCVKHGVRRLSLFGSGTGSGSRPFNPATSDFDFAVEFNRFPNRLLADQYFDLLADLEQLLGRRVQLLTDNSVQNPVLQHEINSTRELIYDASSQEAAA